MAPKHVLLMFKLREQRNIYSLHSWHSQNQPCLDLVAQMKQGDFFLPGSYCACAFKVIWQHTSRICTTSEVCLRKNEEVETIDLKITPT